jgi:hypothetical protein
MEGSDDFDCFSIDWIRHLGHLQKFARSAVFVWSSCYPPMDNRSSTAFTLGADHATLRYPVFAHSSSSGDRSIARQHG